MDYLKKTIIALAAGAALAVSPGCTSPPTGLEIEMLIEAENDQLKKELGHTLEEVLTKKLDSVTEKTSEMEKELETCESNNDRYKRELNEGFDFFKHYDVALMERNVDYPAKLNAEMYQKVKQFRAINDEKERAKAIYNWVISTVEAGDAKRAVGYRTSIETLSDREGVCGEQTYLYVAIARASDLKAKYLRVYRNRLGSKVKHACAAVYPYSNRIDVDFTINTFGVHHEETELISDAEMMRLFKEWRWRKAEPDHLKKNQN